MLEFLLNNISFFVFVFLLSMFLYFKRDRIEVQGSFPFLYMILYKTKFGLNKMNSWADKHKKIFLYLSYFSIFIGVIGLFISIFIMIWGLDYTINNNLGSGGGLVLPIKTDSGMNGSIPIFYVPFIYWILALFILVVVHEFAHGVIAERFKIKVKSSGFAFGALLFPIMPAAFVEPDENKLKKAKWWKQIAVFGAGSTSNFIFGSLFLVVWIFLLVPLVNNTMEINKFEFNTVMNNSDLNYYNITSGEILMVNNISKKELFLNEIKKTKINNTIDLKIKSIINNKTIIKTYSIKTFADPNNKTRPMIGISGIEFDLNAKKEWHLLGKIPLYLEKLFYYFWMLNIGIGIMNLLPIWITDGGQIMKILLMKRFRKELAIKLYNYISIFSLLLIIFTIKPNLLIYLIKLFSFS